MQFHHHNDDSTLLAFFFGAIFNIIADLDGKNLAEYAVKAAIGGLIWLFFKVLSDLASHKLTNKKPKDEN